jgi:hypothetical protein
MLVIPKGRGEVNVIHSMMYNKILSGREAMYGFCAARFTYYFLVQIIEDFEDLYKHLSNDPNM